MELTRRDAIAALGAAGVGVAGGTMLLSSADTEGKDGTGGQSATPAAGGDGDTKAKLGDHETETVVAVAEAVYPAAVENVEEFVRTFLRGRVSDDPDRAAAISDTVSYLDGYTDSWYDVDEFASLSPAKRERAFHRMNADVADPDPDGSNVERVRYYLVNDLLFALYASPTGGELVGIENPQGHPGGATSYQRGPESVREN